MFSQRNGLFPLKVLFVLVFHLLLTHSCRGQSQVIGPSQPIVAHIGDDVILPCRLDPAEDAVAMMLEWTRPDLSPIFVHMRRAGHDLTHSKNPSFTGRTSVSVDELKHGNVSLKLSDVRPSDAGPYRCYMPKMDKGAFVTLVVAAVSSPAIVGISKTSSGLDLQCESEGWHPEPEVSWLDGEGHVLSAGPTETVRGPDGLYTVSSRVTVEKRDNNNFICRVQQKNINQTRETQIYISDDFFEVPSSSAPIIITLSVLLAFCSVFIFSVFFSVCKLRQNIIKTKRSHGDETDKTIKTDEDRERAPLRTDETVEMKVLEKGEKQKKNKHSSLNPYKWFKDEHQRREEAEREVESLNKQVKKLTEEKQSVENKLENEMKELTEEKQRENELQTELDNKKQELSEEKTNRETERRELITELENKETKVVNLTADVTRLKEEKKRSEEELKKQLQQEKNKVQKLTDDKKKIEKEQKDELDKKTKELSEEKKKITQLQKQLEDNKRQADMKQTETDGKLQEANRQLESKKDKIGQLEKQVNDLTEKKKSSEGAAEAPNSPGNNGRGGRDRNSRDSSNSPRGRRHQHQLRH